MSAKQEKRAIARALGIAQCDLWAVTPSINGRRRKRRAA